MLLMGNLETLIFRGVNFYLMKQFVLHIGVNCNIKFLLRLEFSPAGVNFYPAETNFYCDN